MNLHLKHCKNVYYKLAMSIRDLPWSKSSESDSLNLMKSRNLPKLHNINLPFQV